MPPATACTRRALLLTLATLLLVAQPAAAQSDVQPPVLQPGFSHSLVVGGFESPTAMELAPDGRLFVAEKSGRVRIAKDGELRPASFLILQVDTFRDGGLTGLALDPFFAQNGFVYVFFSRRSTPVRNRVSRFTASPSEPDVALADSELVLVEDLPADRGSHNGGGLHFGADGKLYVGVGDGATNPMDAQRLDSLNGKLLRINPDGSIPPDNPFVGEPGARPEIWAYGLRNPFTFAVQPAAGTILINDVGGGLAEEINLGAAGANYGWPLCEGPCAMAGLVDPMYTYAHDIGCTVAGGVFYPGGPFPPSYAGVYFYADFMAGWISALDLARGESTPLAIGVRGPLDMRVGSDGALYYLSYERGAVYRIDYTSGLEAASTAPELAADDLMGRTFLCIGE